MGSYEEFDQLLSIVDAGLPIHIDSVFPLDDYEAALDKLTRGAHLGKIVLDHGVQ
jgi:NADPH:quinone reductase-like Zn-dependent oxidoreductase